MKRDRPHPPIQSPVAFKEGQTECEEERVLCVCVCVCVLGGQDEREICLGGEGCLRCLNLCVRVRTYTHTFADTHTHTHTHIHMLKM